MDSYELFMNKFIMLNKYGYKKLNYYIQNIKGKFNN